ncbi:cupin domain-containing protein [Acinetobacter sp.]|jgi:anti-sigma factor ChrR (cupin superfamily)|uniref:cupin domain-containing protein n=1 Tax=Acinetobacter sp. TaxID=472 RepID=UPI0028298B6E|nr:cupin domain-containing protein [Acinetobacter sp.]MDR2249742.1 cupin domain-containing protein [Acinetobacter sp.]
MLIHADFSQAVIIKPEDYHWVQSPRGEVDRVMLDRIGDEVARATSLVKYAPHTTFPEHRHHHGEEILVLSGVFTENLNQHYPAGWYLRSPHLSVHQPSSKEGTLIFVKLMQIPTSETQTLRINTNDPAQWQEIGSRLICTLVDASYEHTYLEKLNPQQFFTEDANDGIEILITQGQLVDKEIVYETGTWIRLPPKTHVHFQAGLSGSSIYVKTGHLASAIAEYN